MSMLLHSLVADAARRRSESSALTVGKQTLAYAALQAGIEDVARGLGSLHLRKTDRVAVYLEKRLETVVAMFGAAAAGGVFVPLNPALMAPQVAYVLSDCNVRVLVTSQARFGALRAELVECPDLRYVVLVDGEGLGEEGSGYTVLSWAGLLAGGTDGQPLPSLIDQDMAAILYTSGSTGKPKGVVLSHRNMVEGAISVSTYLENNADDVILSVLPLSFDAGFSQLSTGFRVGAHVVLVNYLLPRDVVRLCERHHVTGLTCVPPLWIQLSRLDWPDAVGRRLRYFANTGGHMPKATLDRLRQCFPEAKPYLMYGLTEAFRSTYLDPSEVDRRPDSIGKAIPNAEILVVHPDGSFCGPGEEGELVHRGALVALGYWNDAARTEERFKPAPGQPAGIVNPELAVWSGDTVRIDRDGFLYFVGRSDDMIKTSGYRVSATEVEEVVLATGLAREAVAVGIPHEELGQAILVVVTPLGDAAVDTVAILDACRQGLPNFQVPRGIVEQATIALSPNGKFDRRALVEAYRTIFKEDS